MDRYIRIYNNILSEEQCLHYISLINNGERKAGKFVGPDGTPMLDESIKKSEDISISTQYPDELPFLMRLTSDIITQYEKEVDCTIPCVSLETFRGRVYRENEGYYTPHIDNAKPITYSRMLTIIFYLNDILEGGELFFEKQDVLIQAKAGRVVCFPCYWQYVHEARPSLKGDRYIMRTFAKGPE
jgi:hypothetical protein